MESLYQLKKNEKPLFKWCIYDNIFIYIPKEGGVSWTLRYETAEYFAETYIRNFATNHLTKVVHELVVNKSEVIAFFNERNEFEIIYIQPEA